MGVITVYDSRDSNYTKSPTKLWSVYFVSGPVIFSFVTPYCLSLSVAIMWLQIFCLVSQSSSILEKYIVICVSLFSAKRNTMLLLVLHSGSDNICCTSTRGRPLSIFSTRNCIVKSLLAEIYYLAVEAVCYISN